MEELNDISQRQHKMVMNNRKNCVLTGVKDVIAFDVNEVILETNMGMLLVKGKNLHVKRLTLDKGEVDLEGRVDSFGYTDQGGLSAKSESFFHRLWK
jgi:sporulation protein YabP